MDCAPCGKCGETKTLDLFPRRGRDGKVRTSSCKACRAAYMRQYIHGSPQQRQRQRDRAKAYVAARPGMTKANKLRLKYGLTLGDYRAISAAQGDVCAICGCEDRDVDKRTGKRRELAVDHDHETGTVRGLLCGDCNRALGLVKESAATLARMIAYLATHKPTRKAA